MNFVEQLKEEMQDPRRIDGLRPNVLVNRHALQNLLSRFERADTVSRSPLHGQRWRNKKTGHFYTTLSKGTDVTNSRDGEWVVVYQSEAGEIFVREAGEFFEKFEKEGP